MTYTSESVSAADRERFLSLSLHICSESTQAMMAELTFKREGDTGLQASRRNGFFVYISQGSCHINEILIEMSEVLRFMSGG